MRRLLTALVATAVTTAAPAWAHDIWIVPEGQGAAVVGKVKFGDPSKLEVADKGKIVSLEVIGPSGQKTSLKRPLKPVATGALGLETGPLNASEGSIVAVTYDNGYFAVDPADKVESNTSKLLMPTGKDSVWVPKFGKTLLGPGSYRVRTHTLLELVPVNDPYTASVKVKVRAEFAGKPLNGLRITVTDGLAPIPEKTRPFVTTGADGTVEIDVSRKGAYLLTADYLAPGSQPALADKDEVYATLAFNSAP
jgi:nickel transport protein